MVQSTQWSRLAADRLTDHYRNPLPRTIIRAGTPLLLDGVWQFELDLHARGLEEHWEQGHQYTGEALWPASIESQI